MIDISIFLIPSQNLSVVVWITSFASRHDAIAYHNIWADFWRYNIGVNVIPVDTKNKKPVVPWFGWQSKAIPESLHRQWKTEGLFSNGIAVILGKVWHRQDLTNYYLVGADADSKKAIDEIYTYNGKRTILEEFAEKTLVEQHRDNPNKAHFYFYATKPIKEVAIMLYWPTGSRPTKYLQ